jgi:Predicted membrane protein
MVSNHKLLRALSYSCFFGITSFVLTLFFSIFYNPWFNIFEHAFSDLGSNNAKMPWIYNYGLIFTSVFVMLFSVFMIIKSKGKLEIIGGSFFFISGIFLALIGMYPAGTRPHTFVSTYFFIQSNLAILTWSLGILNKKKNVGLTFLVIGFISPLLGFFINWPSVALQETFGIIIIIAWVITVYFIYSKIEMNSSSK